MNNSPEANKLFKLFLNPFQFIAGANALLIGILIIILASVVGYTVNCRFDGLIDVHSGLLEYRASYLVFITEGLGNWLVLAFILTLSARIVTKSKYRIIDIFGTTALARYPYFFIPLFYLIPGFNRYSQYITAKYIPNTTAVTIYPADLPLFIIGIVCIIFLSIYSIILMYRAFSVSCNASGTKAIWYFIIVCVVVEILTKLLSYCVSIAFK
jgi:hypothetical protein